MDETARRLGQLLYELWQGGASDQDLAVSIAEEAFSWQPTSLTIAARCVEAIRVADLPPSFSEQTGRFTSRVEELVRRAHQLDALGDPGTRPEALFEIFREEAEAGAFDASGFDARALSAARTPGTSRVESGWRLLTAFGLDRLPSGLRDDLTVVYEDLKERAGRSRSQALFVDTTSQRGVVLGIGIGVRASGAIVARDQVDEAMRRQAEIAFDRALRGKGVDWSIEWAVRGEGSSIGVACFVAGLTEGDLPVDPLTCGTGEIDVDGTVRGVLGIPAKLEAAYHSGMRRVVLPEENRPDATTSPHADRLQLLFVGNTSEIHGRLREVQSATELRFDGLVAFVEALIVAPDSGLDLVQKKGIDHGVQFVVANADGKATINVYSTGTVTPSGTPGSSALASAQRIRDLVEASKPSPRARHIYKVPPGHRQQTVEDLLRQAGAIDTKAAQHEKWRLELLRGQSRAMVSLYETGTLMLFDGTAPAHDEARALIEQALAGILPSPPAGTSDSGAGAPKIDESKPHIGTDEAGKGDYFGPLISAAMFVDARLAERLRAMGVRDSKRLNDRMIRRLAADIRSVAPQFAKVTKIPPRTYNDLYEQFRQEGKNLNQLLAWGHVRSIEDLLKRGVRAELAVVDQFADRRYIEGRILPLTRESRMEIVQFPKAEADIAVAAASVLARDAFVEWFEQASTELGWLPPKGASLQVIEAARRLVAEKGQDALREYVKLSFKTTASVLA